MKYVRIETVLDKLVRGNDYLTYPHHRILPFGNSDDNLVGNETDSKFWDDDFGLIRVAYPYPTHVCLEFEYPEPPND